MSRSPEEIAREIAKRLIAEHGPDELERLPDGSLVPLRDAIAAALRAYADEMLEEAATKIEADTKFSGWARASRLVRSLKTAQQEKVEGLPPMTDRSTLIEKAAKAMNYAEWSIVDGNDPEEMAYFEEHWNDMVTEADSNRDDEFARGARAKVTKLRKLAEAALSAAAPGLLDGTAWIAPWEATEAMIVASRWYREDDGRVCWRDMRDAHLKPE